MPGNDDWRERLEKSRTRIGYALRQQDTATILSDPVRPALRAAQPAGFTAARRGNSDVNRNQVRDGAAVLGCLLPIFIDLMMDAPGHDWPMPHYPPVGM